MKNLLLLSFLLNLLTSSAQTNQFIGKWEGSVTESSSLTTISLTLTVDNNSVNWGANHDVNKTSVKSFYSVNRDNLVSGWVATCPQCVWTETQHISITKINKDKVAILYIRQVTNKQSDGTDNEAWSTVYKGYLYKKVDRCVDFIPKASNVMVALRGFAFDNSLVPTKAEAEKILKTLCPDVVIHYPDIITVCGIFPSGYHLTLWLGTYGKNDRYGARYGLGDDHSYFMSNDTYFEIPRLK
jgi:hypothetical protein